MKKIICLSLLLIPLILFSHAFANDTDLYILTQMMTQVPPDALIMLDLSGSMNYTPAMDTLYVALNTNCSNHNYNSSFNGPYYSLSGTGHTWACNSVPQTGGPIYGDSSCSDTTGFYKTSGTGHTQNCSKLAIAKRAIFAFLDTDNGTGTGTPDGIINSSDQSYLKMRMGYMRFYDCNTWETISPTSYTGAYNRMGNCNTVIDVLNSPYSKIYCNSATSCTTSSSASNSVSGELAANGTPLAAVLNEALYYFNDSKSSDIDAACRQKFAILITDGQDTYACNGTGYDSQTDHYKRRRETVAQARALANAGYYVFVIGFGTNMPLVQQYTLNWAAYFGKTYNKDQAQSITQMYTIPFGQVYPSGITYCQASTTTTDPQGNTIATTNDPGAYGISGYAFIAQNESQLDDAIMSIRNFILALVAQSTSYVAPVVPISQFQNTSSENRMYLGMFKPTTTTMWDGNIKRYGIATTNTSTYGVGDLIDVNNQLVMTSQNTIQSTAQSYWSPSADGGDVDQGGIGKILLSGNPDSRNIYTYLGTQTSLTNSSNAFTKSNTAITPTLLGLSSGDTAGSNNIVDFIHGWDVWNWNLGPGNKRSWILGAFIHSRPLVIHYGNQDVIYAGANDGMLHAFDDATGNELWAFIPPDLLPNLRGFNTALSSVQIFVDGPPKAYVNYQYNNDGSINKVNQAILIFGERRGGNHYTALDVTNASSPNFLWSISPSQIIYGTTTTSTTAYQELGQSWSTPVLGTIKNGSGTKVVAFIGGGYDATHEDTTPAGTDTSGRAIYVVDITNGSQIWKYSYSNDSNMKYCIPSDITPIDVNGDGLIERLYVGDVGGEVWRFDIGDMSNTGSWTAKLIFKGSGKIFYPPDVTFENDIGSGTYDMLFFGTGDRENPNDTTVVNTLYAIKDYDNDTNPPTPLPLTPSNLVDATSDVLQSPTATQTQKANFLNNLKTKSGWYITLNQSPGESPNPGEKCTAPATVFGGAVYYSTLTPTPIDTQSVCTIATGSGNVYTLQYQTGNAVLVLNLDNILQHEKTPSVTDRSIGTVGAGIPSGIILTVINGSLVGYGGVAGGVFSPQLPTIKSIIPLDWRIVF
jgi:type IV pilus assembly protein PilY1